MKHIYDEGDSFEKRDGGTNWFVDELIDTNNSYRIVRFGDTNTYRIISESELNYEFYYTPTPYRRIKNIEQ